MKSLVKNSFFNTIKATSSLVFPLISYTYLAHILMAEGMGKVEFARSYTAYFSMLSMLGIVNYATREASKLRRGKDDLSIFVLEILIINFIAVIFSVLLFIISIWKVGYLHQYTLLLLINGFSIILTALGMDWLYAAVEDYQYIAIRTIIFQFISLILVLVFIHDKNDIYKYAAIQVLSSTGSNVLNFLHSRKYLKFGEIHIADLHIRRHIKPIFLLFGMTLCIQVFTHLDTTMLGFISGDTSVGLYTAATKMTNVVCSMLVAVTAVITPRIALYYKEDRWKQIKDISYFSIKVIFILGIPAVFGSTVLAPQIIEIFSGNSFMNAVPTARLLSARILLSPLNTFAVVNLFIPIGREKNNLYTTGIAAVINFLLNLLLIPNLQEYGAAIATVSAEIVELICNLFFVRGLLEIRNFKTNIRNYLLGSLLIVGVWMFFSQYLTGIRLLFVCVVISVPSYFFTLWIFKDDMMTDIINYFCRVKMK